MSTLPKVAVSIFVLLCLPWAFGQQRDEQVEPISSALRAKDFDRAVSLSRSALRESPNNPQLWTLQGIALAGEGHSDEALAAFQRALKISPNSVPALAGAAQIEYETGGAEAVPLLNRLLRLRPDDPTAHAMLAVLAYRQANCDGATAHFQKAGELIHSQLDALHAYAACLMKLNKMDLAEQVFQRAVSLRPNDPRERQLLASVQISIRKPKDALATLAPLLESSSPDVSTLQLASSAYEDNGDTPQAVSTLRQAILLDPRNVSTYLDFANIAFAHESFQVGIDVISEGIRLQPQAAQLYVARGVLYVQLAQYDQAQIDFEKAEQLDPTQSLSVAAQGLAAVQANDPEHALATVQAKLSKKPNDPMLLHLQADVLSQKGVEPGTPEFQLAMRSASRAVALRPALSAARVVLAKLYMQNGEYQKAADQCRSALAIDPKDQTAVYRLIQSLRKMGNQSELPGLLNRLALLRQEATKEERERYRYKLIEEGTPPEQPRQP
jgi:tetratricopeptide (TPR) repeat protein